MTPVRSNFPINQRLNVNSAFHANVETVGGGGDVTQRSPQKNGCEEDYNSYFMARLQATPSLLYGRSAALVHGKILCSMTAVYLRADLGGGSRGCAPPPPPQDALQLSNTTVILY